MITGTSASYAIALDREQGGYGAYDSALHVRPGACRFSSTRVLHRRIHVLLGLSGCRASVVDGEQDFLSHTVLCSWNCSPAQDSIVVCSFPLRTKDFHLSSKGRPAYA
jgi:hypothetical protein